MGELLRPQDLKKIAEDMDMAKAREGLDSMKKREEQESALRDAFMHREVHPEAAERVNAAVRRAAANGLNEVQVFTFPASYCNDGGRRINNAEADWPSSLEGFAKRAYEYYEKELRPLGYKVQVRVLSFPGGLIGEIGLFLRW